MMPDQVRRLTIRDYERIEIGRIEASADKWDHTRTIENAIINFGGMGAKKYIPISQTRGIPLIDNQDMIIPISNIEQAYKLLNTF